MNINNIASILQAEQLQIVDLEFDISQIIIDSRKIIFPIQSLFFAIVGERHNAHNYLNQVYNQGIRNFVVSENIAIADFPKSNILLVPNSLEALQMLGKAYRAKYDLEVIGITGSNGKTIVKEWLFQLLHDRYNIVRSPRSYNSQVGVPLSIFGIQKDHNLGIFEAGISKPGEMEKIAPIISPSIGIFTNIGDAHNEGFKNLDQKVKEKLCLFEKCDHIIYCKDYPLIEHQIKETYPTKNLISWSKNIDATYQIEKHGKKDFIFSKDQKQWTFQFPFKDEASVENIIHCIVLLLEKKELELTIQEKLDRLFKLEMRMDIKQGINNCTIINDAYNFDLSALKIALSQLENEDAHLKKTIILSDILEHNPSADLYPSIADLLRSKNIEKVIGIGDHIHSIKQHLGQNIESYFYTSTDQFLRTHSHQNFKKELILLKGARTFQFEKISAFLSEKSHHTILEIDLDAIGHNLKYYNNLLQPDTKIMAMIKASAYGSGSIELAKFLSFQKVDYLGVANADEGVELRKAGIQTPILVLNPEEDIIDVLLEYKLEPEIYNLEFLKVLEQHLKLQNLKMGIHLNLNTGMNRLGFDQHEIPQLLTLITGSEQIIVRSIFSHLASSEKDDHDDRSIAQIEAFDFQSTAIINRLKENDNYLPIRHILNSGGISRFTKYQYDMVRLGIGLYGIGASEEVSKSLLKVHTLKAKILQIRTLNANEGIGYHFKGRTTKTSIIATVGIGYADGLIRQCGNGNFYFRVNGEKAPIIGNVSMDMTTIDITHIPNVKAGDHVIIFDQNGGLEELAHACNTISYEVLSRISSRVKRVFYQE